MTITRGALDKLAELKTNPDDVLNISILGFGCSGLGYKMEWQDCKVSYDKQICAYFEDIPIIVVTDNKSALFLEDVELDYNGGLNGTGFVWNNPKAKRVCGCGSSFSV